MPAKDSLAHSGAPPRSTTYILPDPRQNRVRGTDPAQLCPLRIATGRSATTPRKSYPSYRVSLGPGIGCPRYRFPDVATLTRRNLLIGIGAGAGAVVAGGTGVVALLGRGHRQRLLNEAGLDPGPDGHVSPSDVTITSGRLMSAYMHGSVGWSISMPTRPPQAVIYCLHGLGGDHTFAFDQIHLPDVVESVHAPLAVASVDGGHDSYWHPRADGTDAMAMLLDDFIPFVARRTNTSRAALLGWSMGGYGALLAAERAPERFFAVAAASPALWTSPGQTAPGAFDSAADFYRFDVFRGEKQLDGLTVRVDCGTGDPFYQADRRFVAGLAPGHQGSFGTGFHEAGYWRSVAPAQVTTIAQALPQEAPRARRQTP
jgi:pimeloyl-ACP methyl ester carboxylesterase